MKTETTSPIPSLAAPQVISSASTVNVVSILAPANREARSKRRVTFAEELIDAAFSPEPPQDMEDTEDDDNDISSSTQGNSG